MTKVEAVVLRERVEIVIDAVEEQTGHVGVTVVEAVGHGRERGITHEYRGRVFESRFLPKALLTFVVADELAAAVAATVADAARSGNDSGDGLVWTTPVGHVLHHRTGPHWRRRHEQRRPPDRREHALGRRRGHPGDVHAGRLRLPRGGTHRMKNAAHIAGKNVLIFGVCSLVCSSRPASRG